MCSGQRSSFLDNELDIDTLTEYTASEPTDVPSTMSAREIRPVDLVVECVRGETTTAILLEPTCLVNGGNVILLAQPLNSYGEGTAQKAQKRLKEIDADQEFFIVKMDIEQLAELSRLVSQVRLTPCLDSVFPHEQGKEAVLKIEKKRTVGDGKVIIRFDQAHQDI